MPEFSQHTGKELMLQLINGEEAAFSTLYHAHVNMVFRRIKRLVHIHAVAEELTQDVFFQLWKQRDRLNPEIPFEAIALQTAKSMAINFYQRAIREQEIREQLVDAASLAYNPVEDAVDFNETRALLDEAIAKLPPQRQRVFNLCKVQGKRYEDVADELGVSIGTIKDHMAKAMRFLKQEFASRSEKSSLYAILAALLFQ